MILTNHLEIPAAADAVFALINDAKRVAGCLPGAVLEGQDEDTYLGRVKFKVGPVTAEYAGSVRFTEVVPEQRRVQISARGADSYGNGDAEARVDLAVVEAPGGSALNLETDLVIRGKIAQFGKGAITSVSSRLLDQFARNIAEQLRADPAAVPPGDVARAASGAPQPFGAADQTEEALDGLAMLLPANAGRYAALAGVAVLGFVQGWLLGRVRSQERLIKALLE